MQFEEFITKVKKVINNYGSISFSDPNWDNGISFGVIEESNLAGIFIAGKEHHLGDGDTAMSDIHLCKSVSNAFSYIWSNNCFDKNLGSYKDYDFRFDMVEGLYAKNCYYVIKI